MIYKTYLHIFAKNIVWCLVKVEKYSKILPLLIL